MKDLLQRGIILLFSLFLPLFISAKTVTGTVRDTKGEAIIGASILEQNTTNGTVTDFDGHYQLNIEVGKNLVVSYVGYTSRTVRIVENKSVYDIVLEEDNELLEDVVVVGYGTQKRSDVTGAISSVSAKDIESFSTKSLAESLQGLAAGVSVTKGSGAPGEGAEILIRGAGNLSGMSPLYVVDGVAQDAGFNFNMRDVESIEILKDAGSAAIYGSRAAGGVILITTKHGKQEKTHVTLNIRAGWRKTMNKLNLLGTEDWIAAKDAWPTGKNTKTTLETLKEEFNVNSIDELPNTNWMDVMYGTGIEQEYNVGISHSGDKTNMFMSIGYMDEKGTYMGTRAQRFSFRTNLDHKISKHVSIGESIYGTWSKTDPAAQSSVYYHTIPFRTVPVMEVKDADGNYAQTPVSVGSGPNFAGIEDAFKTYHNDNYNLNARAYLDVNFIEGLNWHTNASANLSAYSSNQFQEYKDFGKVQVGAPGGQLFSSAGTTLNLMFNSTLTYDHTWGNHHFKAMVGTEWWRLSGYGMSTTAYNFTVSPAQSIALASEGNTKDASDNLPQERRGSAFARINYEYGGRYMLAVNFRADASDRFVKKNRWGFFPSVNAGWRMSEEPWIKEPTGEWLSNMKIRASWGMLGNDNVAQYMYESTYALTGVSYAFDNASTRSTGAWLAVLGNENLRWEQVNQWDLGLDLGFLNNRLTFTYDYYNRQTRDMIYRGSLPLSSGMSYYFASDDPGNTVPVYLNAGLVENQGHEIALGWKEKRGEFEYGIVWNASFNQNMVKQVGDAPGAKPIDAGIDADWNFVARTEDGRPMGQFYGYKCLGIFQDQAQVDAYNLRALNAWKANNDPDGTKYKYSKTGQPLDGLGNELGIYYQNKNTGVGDLIFDDNGVGRVMDKSKQFIGNPWPKMEMGLTLNFAWRGIDLSAVFSGAFGFDIMNLMKPYTNMFSSDNTTKNIFHTSCFGKDNTTVTDDPRIGFLNDKGKFFGDGSVNKNYSTVSSYLLEKGDYFKLKNLSLGYTLPSKWTTKAHIEKLRLYFSAQNVFTITKYSGNDPEIGRYSAGQLLWNVDTQYRYLPNRLFSFGLDVMF